MTKKCGIIALLGAPNAGKSTLINALVGQKVAITSAKPQTTRTRLLGIAMEGESQIVLVDTPGIFEPRRRMDRAMVNAAWTGSEDSDAIALVVDATAGLRGDVEAILEALSNRSERKLLILNKVDKAKKDRLLTLATELGERCNFAEIFFVSALTGDGIGELKTYLADNVPDGPWLFPEDQVSDISERLLAAEVTREQLFRQLHQELPYAIAVTTELYKNRPDGSVEIRQQILVERKSQRGIVLGKQGQQIKAIGAAAREELRQMTGRKVHLFLHVKVAADWSDKRDIYEEIGLDWTS